jgi:hypothetical protein
MENPDSKDSGEDMNVRLVHGAIWREFAEPIEAWRRAPWYLRHSYVMMLIGALVYLLIQVYDWKEYEEDPVRRIERDTELYQYKENAAP